MDRGSGVGTASPWVEEEGRACQENGEVWYGGSGRTGGLRVRLEQARMAMVVGESASVMLLVVCDGDDGTHQHEDEHRRTDEDLRVALKVVSGGGEEPRGGTLA